LHNYLVRFGAFAHIATFSSEAELSLARGNRVVCRTKRGLETGEVLTGSQINGVDLNSTSFAGHIIRRTTPQDEMLIARLEKNKDEAVSACLAQIESAQLDIALIDAEQLFDGQSIFFYFLGETDPTLDEITSQLAETYESKVQFRKFTEAVNEGCGPSCGTGESHGCGSSGCGSCAISGHCKPKT
jgi:cell fate regulator YaaT (PSP1 superfamily)